MKPPQDFGTRQDAANAIAKHVTHGAGKAPMIAIGPLVWGIETGHDTKHWYFVVASISAKGRLRLDQINVPVDNRDFAQEARTDLFAALIGRRPIVIHDFDDELAMAKWAEAIAPSERTRRIRQGLEQERRDVTDHP
jgi:hypothetical protein